VSRTSFNLFRQTDMSTSAEQIFERRTHGAALSLPTTAHLAGLALPEASELAAVATAKYTSAVTEFRIALIALDRPAFVRIGR
jgi:hypothetical protein